LFPAGVTSPFSGTPPSMTNFSMFFSGEMFAEIVRQILRSGKNNHLHLWQEKTLAPSARIDITVDLHGVTGCKLCFL
jgi:hypothetical protein